MRCDWLRLRVRIELRLTDSMMDLPPLEGHGGRSLSALHLACALGARIVPKLCPTPAQASAFLITPAHDAVQNLSFEIKHFRVLRRTVVQD